VHMTRLGLLILHTRTDGQKTALKSDGPAPKSRRQLGTHQILIEIDWLVSRLTSGLAQTPRIVANPLVLQICALRSPYGTLIPSTHTPC
jgi:hypothetical protein